MRRVIGAVGLAFVAAAVGAGAAVDLAGSFAQRLPSAGGGMRAAADAFTRAGNEERDPEAADRRRLLTGFSVLALFVAWFVFGFATGAVAAAIAPVVASRVLQARLRRYREAVNA